MSKASQHGETVPSTITATGIFKTVPISSIMIDSSRNLRFGKADPKKMSEMESSIAVEGLHNPLTVSELSGDAASNGYTYRLEAGYKRAQCIINLLERNAHDGHVNVHVESFNTDADTHTVNYSENAARQDLSIMDTSVAINAWKSDGLTDVEISKKIGKSRSYVSMVGRLMTLPAEYQERIHLPKDNPKHIPWTTARELTTMGPEDQAKMVAELDAANESGTAGRTQDTARKAKADQDGKTPGKIPSSKKVLGFVEDRVKELREAAAAAESEGKKGLTKAQGTALTVFDLMGRLLKGKLGGQAFVRKVEELL
jgi:ParB-like chromosome segregation protein Spo0J